MKRFTLLLLCVFVLAPIAAQTANHAVSWAIKSEGVKEDMYNTFAMGLLSGAEELSERLATDEAKEMAKEIQVAIVAINVQTIIAMVDELYGSYSNWTISNEDALSHATMSFIVAR